MMLKVSLLLTFLFLLMSATGTINTSDTTVTDSAAVQRFDSQINKKPYKKFNKAFNNVVENEGDNKQKGNFSTFSLVSTFSNGISRAGQSYSGGVRDLFIYSRKHAIINLNSKKMNLLYIRNTREKSSKRDKN